MNTQEGMTSPKDSMLKLNQNGNIRPRKTGVSSVNKVIVRHTAKNSRPHHRDSAGTWSSRIISFLTMLVPNTAQSIACLDKPAGHVVAVLTPCSTWNKKKSQEQQNADTAKVSSIHAVQGGTTVLLPTVKVLITDDSDRLRVWWRKLFASTTSSRIG